MKLCFIGSGIERSSTRIAGIEIQSIADVVRSRFDTLVFGGSSEGLMGQFASAFAARGGAIVSVVPTWLQRAGLAYEGSPPIVCESLSERKQLMFETVDAVLCYPGGVGTMDELFELLADRSVASGRDGAGVSPPIYLYNWEKFYAPLLLQLETAEEVGLIHKGATSGVHPFENADALRSLLTTSAWSP